MIPKSVERFSDQIMRNQGMIRKSVERFSDQIMLNQNMIRKSVERFSSGEARSLCPEIMLKSEAG